MLQIAVETMKNDETRHVSMVTMVARGYMYFKKCSCALGVFSHTYHVSGGLYFAKGMVFIAGCYGKQAVAKERVLLLWKMSP